MADGINGKVTAHDVLEKSKTGETMYSIFSQTDKVSIPVIPGSTILESTLKAGINHVHYCGGNAECTTCRVYVTQGLSSCEPRNEKEKHLVDKLGLPGNIRLACQTKITGDIVVRRPVIDDLDIKILLRQIDDASGSHIGQEQELAILFTDIENYTSFAESFPAYDIVHVLHRYYQTMNEIIVKHRGMISDVAGDGILALFGVIKDGRNPVLNAIRSVREMNASLEPFNEYLNEMFGWSFRIRAGINFGKVIVGNFEIGRLRKISVFGDEVNLAHRIETTNKDFGTRLLISQSACNKIHKEVKSLKGHPARLKGKSGEYMLYEIEI